MPTPLTDADKVLRNDVGKRMAVALEAIAEGSGGSAKIEEMTQAEYDALTPAQKADGTLRAISDGETSIGDIDDVTLTSPTEGQQLITDSNGDWVNGNAKIQDLDNVTLTTSDNNKLLGVTVSSGDISVGAVSSLFKVISFNLASCTVNANGTLALRGNEFTDTTDVIPPGFSPIAIAGEYNTNNSIIFLKTEATQAGGTGLFVTLGNNTASNQTGYIQVKILYIKNSLL